jgi:hypothetical protein
MAQMRCRNKLLTGCVWGNWSYHTSELQRHSTESTAIRTPYRPRKAAGIGLDTAQEWLERFQEANVKGIQGRSTRQAEKRTNLDCRLRQRIEQLHRARMPMRRIAAIVGHSFSKVCRMVGPPERPSSLNELEPIAPIIRYERVAPDELLFIDSEKLERAVRPSHRVMDKRRDSTDGAGWEFAYVAIDDHSLVSSMQMHANDLKDSTASFLLAALAHYEARGRKINA